MKRRQKSKYESSECGSAYNRILEFQLVWKDFDLKIGDIIIAPYTVYDTIFTEKEVNLKMRVTAIYPHIFVAEALELAPSGRVRSKAYRKVDYSIGRIRKKK